MSDLLRMESRVQIIQARAKEIYQQLQKEQDEGLIGTEVEFKHRFFNMLYDFFVKLGKPQMVVREAWGPPFSEDYNLTMEEIQKDFYTAFAEIEALKSGYKDAFEHAEVARTSLEKQISLYEQKVEEYALQIKQAYNEVLFRESFDNGDKYERDFVRSKPALISPEVGGLILSPIVSEKLTDGTIRILDGSNGFPGNTHQVRVLNGAIRFYGETDAHLNFAELLDGNADTWFEFENYYMNDDVRNEIQNIGLDYEEKVSWVFSSPDVLRLNYEVEFPYAKNINWLGLSPFLPSEKGAKPATIQSIVIHDGKGKRTTITANEKWEENKIWMFESQLCKKIVVQLTQPNSYETKVGHLYFKELETQAAHYLDKGKVSGRRVKGTMPSIEQLGIRWDKQAQKIVWGEYTSDTTFSDMEKRKSALFSVPITPDFVQADFEALTAYRYVIGLREMSMYLYMFDSSSEYVSTPFYSPQPILTIELEADQFIPESFEEGDWIRYLISIDDGQNWHPIVPKGNRQAVQSGEGSPKKIYYVNTNTPKELRNPLVGYLELPEPVHTVRLKIELSRPIEKVGYTPVVKEARIRATTVSEVTL